MIWRWGGKPKIKKEEEQWNKGIEDEYEKRRGRNS